jgi:tRNA threonylcarbamoyladenosine modification (KEOPS) complex Cgi121 subunit
MTKFGIKEGNMILIAVIVGYMLGIAPSIYRDITDKIKEKKQVITHETEKTEQQEIFEEWLNGPKEVNKTEITQEDIYKEYTTGIVEKGE